MYWLSVLLLEEIDVDGAVRETRDEALDGLAGDTRLSFLRKSAITGGAALSGGAVLGALGPGVALAAGGGRPPASSARVTSASSTTR